MKLYLQKLLHNLKNGNYGSCADGVAQFSKAQLAQIVTKSAHSPPIDNSRERDIKCEVFYFYDSL